MTEKKKHTYNSSVMALPPLKVVIGDVPTPDVESRHTLPGMLSFRPFGADRPEVETKDTIHKLIGHIQKTK